MSAQRQSGKAVQQHSSISAQRQSGTAAQQRSSAAAQQQSGKAGEQHHSTTTTHHMEWGNTRDCFHALLSK
jgi:hypothetical protein